MPFDETNYIQKEIPEESQKEDGSAFSVIENDVPEFVGFKTFRPLNLEDIERSFAENAAQMYVYDVDGDGLNDVITVWHCHKYGLVWHKQIRGANGEISWEKHEILPVQPDLESKDLRISQMHSLALADTDGDGIKEIITGKRFWAHGEHGDPESNQPAVIYAFEIKRGESGVEFIPHMIDGDSGAGTQIITADLSGGGRADVLTSGKKGVYAHFYNSFNVL